jgi:methyl-accepting chemotaxis protein
MLNVKNLSIGTKLGCAFGVLFLGLVIMTVICSAFNRKIEQHAIVTKDKSSHFAILAKDAKVCVIQVQQWLTDISATRGAQGFDDGFREAEKYAKKFKDISNEFRTMYSDEKDNVNLSKIDSITVAFDAYYESGKIMAKEYVEKGPAAGNVYMQQFDLYARTITQKMDAFVDDQIDDLHSNMNTIVKVSSSSSVSVVLLGIVLVILGSIMSFLFYY